MKRSEHLIPLSHDHHRGLAFSKKLRDGLSEGANADSLGAAAVSYWYEHLRPHFELEEAHLLPELRRLRASRLAWQLRKEHQQIAALVERLQSPHPTARTTLSVLAETMTYHIRFEERELFPFLEKHLDNQALARIGQYLHDDDGAVDSKGASTTHSSLSF